MFMESLISELSVMYNIPLNVIENIIIREIEYYKINVADSVYKDSYTLESTNKIQILPHNIQSIISIEGNYPFHYNYCTKILAIITNDDVKDNLKIECNYSKSNDEIIKLSGFKELCISKLNRFVNF